MKKYLLSLLLLVGCGIASAQKVVYMKLTDGTTIEKKVWEVESIYFQNDADTLTAETPEYVDLGLSVKWATFNMGATKETEVGSLIGWGDITGTNLSTDLAWYPVSDPSGDIILTSYDIALHKWGDKWRMPSADEFQELIDNCTWEYTTKDGVEGYEVSNNGNSIFLPLTGLRTGSTTTKEDELGYYWTGNLSSTSTNNAKMFQMSSDSKTIGQCIRYCGLAIRAVYGEYSNAVVMTGNNADPKQYSATVTVNYAGDIDNITNLTLKYGTNANLSSASSVTGEASSEGSTTFTLSNLSVGTTYYYTAIADYNNGQLTFSSDTTTFTTKPKYPEADYVDMGTSVKWATWNMGATTMTDKGGYFGWGDGDGAVSESGTWQPTEYAKDNTEDDISGTDYDIAHYIWKGEWRLPTADDWEELLSSCTIEYMSNYNSSGTNGYLITAKNGNTIFLPGGGFYNQSGNYNANYGNYWTANRNPDATTQAKAYEISPANTYSSGWRSVALKRFIRPVYDDGTGSSSETTVKANSEAGSTVDLGLSVYWADRNVGASSSSDAGEYIAWGELEDKTTYTVDTYKYYNDGSYDDLGTSISKTEYDAAQSRWGGNFRMPTMGEITELINQCTWTWTTQNGVSGYKVTGSNGNSIFFPVAGYMSSSSVKGSGSSGRYWSASKNNAEGHSEDYARCLSMSYSSTSKTYSLGAFNRYLGFLIRPVSNTAWTKK